MSDPNGKFDIQWSEIVPTDWFVGTSIGLLWVSAFHIMCLNKVSLSNEPVLLDFRDTRCLILYGQIPYLKTSEPEIRNADIPQFIFQVDEIQAQEGTYLVIFMPFVANSTISEIQSRRQVKRVVGILTSVFGPNIAYHRLFDNIVSIQEKRRSIFGSTVRNPISMPAPQIDATRIQLAETAYRAISNLPASEANRIRLSLEWYFDSLYSMDTDSFLKCWFALEALAMSEDENIKPITKSLSRSYDIPFVQAKSKFAIGRLYEFRNRIVHCGEVYPIHSLLSDYVVALYLDVLFERLGLPNQHRALKILNDPNFDLSALIHST